MSGTLFGERNPGCEKGEEAFKKAIYNPIFKQLNCISCHATRLNPVSAPIFMTEKEAYQNSLSKVDFTTITNSKLIEKVSDSHFIGHGTKIDINEASMKKAIQTWWDNGQKECKANMLTAAIKDEVFDSGSVQILTWDLKTFGSVFEEVFFEMQVRKKSVNDNLFQLTFENPKLVSFQKPVRVKSIKIKIEGQTTVAGFEQVFSVREPQEFLGRVRDSKFSPKLTILPARLNVRRPAKVEVSFEQLELLSDIACSDVTLFKKNVMPRLERCIHCHEVRVSEIVQKRQASGFFMNASSDSEYCKSVKAAAMARSTVESPLFQVFLQKGAHPALLFPFPESDDDRQAISAWLLSEIKGEK